MRAGAVEANLKILSTHLLQRETQKIAPENGIVEQESAQPVYNPMFYMDLNGTIREEPIAQPIFYHMSSIDLNGISHPETSDQTILQETRPAEVNTHNNKSVEPCNLSKDDVQKIQVFSFN